MSSGFGSGGYGAGGYGIGVIPTPPPFNVIEDTGQFGDDPGPPIVQGKQFRPPQWNSAEPQTMVIKPQVKTSSSPATLKSSSDDDTFTFTKDVNAANPAQQYVFDAVLRLVHEQALQMTQHPVQSGANVVDHAYLIPAKLSLEVGFSDAMDAFSSSMYSAANSKSVSAYQTFLDLQSARTPLTVKTRLKTYENMLVDNIMVPDDYKTKFGLRMTIVFKQIILATNNANPSSAIPDATDDTSEGTKSPSDPDPATTQAHQLSLSDIQQVEQAIQGVSTPFIQNLPVNIPGAGSWSSNNISSILNTGPQ